MSRNRKKIPRNGEKSLNIPKYWQKSPQIPENIPENPSKWRKIRNIPKYPLNVNWNP